MNTASECFRKYRFSEEFVIKWYEKVLFVVAVEKRYKSKQLRIPLASARGAFQRGHAPRGARGRQNKCNLRPPPPPRLT